MASRSFRRQTSVPVRRPRAYVDGYALGWKNALPDGDWPWGPRYRRLDFDAGWTDGRAAAVAEWLERDRATVYVRATD